MHLTFSAVRLRLYAEQFQEDCVIQKSDLIFFGNDNDRDAFKLRTSTLMAEVK